MRQPKLFFQVSIAITFEERSIRRNILCRGETLEAKLRSWRKKIKRPRLVVGVFVAGIPVIALIIAIIGGYLFNWTWSGVSQKTLWDWLNLLGVLAIPVVVGFGAA